MKTEKPQLKEIVFTFSESLRVKWEYLGRGVVTGREYPSTYHVDVLRGDFYIGSFKTSFSPNQTNSFAFIAKSKVQKDTTKRKSV